MTSTPDTQRFESGASKYAAYLQTREGQLRLDLALANLQEFLPKPTENLLALDIGGGPGATAIRLARLGVHVTLLDASAPMLDLASQAALEAGVTERVKLQQGDATDVQRLFPARSFDVILCHNILEYVDDPLAVLRIACGRLRDSSSVLSILARNQMGEVLKSAILLGDLDAAEDNLTNEWANESLYGGRVRLFSPAKLRTMLAAVSLGAATERGVRVLSDYLPESVLRNDRQQVFQLECKLGGRQEFSAVARYTQFIAHRAPATSMVGE